MGTISISGNDFSVFSETSDPIADAKVYFSARIGSDPWAGAEKADQRKALVSATRWIQRYLAARIATASSIPDPADTPAPIQVAQAGYETALVLIVDATAQDKPNTGNNKKRLKAGSAEIEYFKPTDGTPFPNIANALLLAYLNSLSSGSSDTGAEAFGTDGVSEFSDQDAFGRSRGFS